MVSHGFLTFRPVSLSLQFRFTPVAKHLNEKIRIDREDSREIYAKNVDVFTRIKKENNLDLKS